ncbi:helix-turn-helix domain-containing protein [Vibrio cincinnatiensis]|uniref:helix-turn-helix domain-containing protein n=1 Tax=Vibrio cincinnatiensis TaxID=675 RepID=UPI00389B771C
MSMLLTAQALKVKVGNAAKKFVLVKLADNANDDGVCWPSYDHIAEMCEMSRRTVIRHIADLEKMGLISIRTRKGSEGRNKSNFYQLNFNGDNLTPPSDKQGKSVVTNDHPDGDRMTPESINEPVKEPINKKNTKKDSLEGSLIPDGKHPKNLNLTAWASWLDYRRKILKKPYKSERGEMAGVAKLLNVSGGDLVLQQKIVDQSLDGEWQGFFPLKTQQQGKGKPSVTHVEPYSENMDTSQHEAPQWFRERQAQGGNQ